MCVCGCVFISACVWISAGWCEAFWSFSAKVPGSSFDGQPCLDVPKDRVCSDLSHKPHSIHSASVCCCCSVCIFTPVMDWEPVLQGPQKHASSLIQLPTRQSWRGNKRLGDSMVCFTQVSSHRAGTKKPINFGLRSYKLDFAFLSLPRKVSKLFPRFPTTGIPEVIPNPSCVRTNLYQILPQTSHCW